MATKISKIRKIGKLKKVTRGLLPIFSEESSSEFVEEILKEHKDLRLAVEANPFYRELLETRVKEVFAKYKRILYGAKVIDSWDRVSSFFGIVADTAGVVTGGLGNLVGLGEEVAESIPKGIYALYYLAKTGDWKALPLWAGYETVSLIPLVGDAVDMTNAYVNRARKMTKEKVVRDFRESVNTSRLEKIVKP